MRLFGVRLVAATPRGPLQDELNGGRRLPDEGEEQAPHLWHRRRQQIGELGCHRFHRSDPLVPISRAAFSVLARPLCRCFSPGCACERTTVR
jgi:hypothetical protein